MPELPAICRACGAVYGSGFVLENTRNATFTGCGTSCPICGGQGDIPSGVYDAIGDTLQIIASSAPSQHQLLRIIAILEKGRDRQADPEEVVAEIEKESPVLAATIRKLLVPRNAGEFYALLGFLLVALTLVKPNISGESKMSSADCEQLTERAVAAAIAQTSQHTVVSPRRVQVRTAGVSQPRESHKKKPKKSGKTHGRDKKHR